VSGAAARAGYTGNGDTFCVDVDECASANGGCDALSACTNTPGGYSCGACPKAIPSSRSPWARVGTETGTPSKTSAGPPSISATTLRSSADSKATASNSKGACVSCLEGQVEID
jgi:hypothetical protein